MTYFGCPIHTHTDTPVLSFFCAFHSEATQRHSDAERLFPAVTLGQKAYMLSYNLTRTCNKEVTPSSLTSADTDNFVIIVQN